MSKGRRGPPPPQPPAEVPALLVLKQKVAGTPESCPHEMPQASYVSIVIDLYCNVNGKTTTTKAKPRGGLGIKSAGSSSLDH